VLGLVRPRLFTHWSGLSLFRFGQFRRVTPISQAWGFDRGLPIDRYYIENFLAGRAEDIRGHVLEMMDATYTRRFGGKRVQKSDVLHASEDNPNATIVADLTRAQQIPSDTFDCIIFTQTLLFIYDVRSVINTLHRILKPGGIVLGTVPGITKISREDMRRSGQYWSFTTLSILRLFEEVFPAEQVEVKAYGNVLTAAAFLYGLATEELRKTELDHRDPDYEVIITFSAAKPTVSW
jgi:SAM-dependent methyltransferase